MSDPVFDVMTEEQCLKLAECADILREFGYEKQADRIGKICEQEITLRYNPDLGVTYREND